MEEAQLLAIPLSQDQIEAARQFWLAGWDSPELIQLNKAFPERWKAVRTKAITLNVLYGTNIFAIAKVAECVEHVLSAPNAATGTTLVEDLVREIRNITHRDHYSFASKYVHLFVDRSVPLLDSYAEWMLEKHLGKMKSKKTNRYEKFVDNTEILKEAAGVNCNSAELDSYLWVAGEYWWWIAHRHKEVNSDLLPFFESLERNPTEEPLLARLLGIEAGVQAVPEIHDRLQTLIYRRV
jgi:hypothetical protein